MSFGNLPSFFLNFSEREMNGEDKHFYKFKSFRLDVKERQLLHHNENIPLTPKVFDVLVALVERHGHLVEKDELLKLVWADSFVEEVNVARSVHALRKVLGENDNGDKFIETVAKKGYRFVAKVTEMSEPLAGASVLSEAVLPQAGGKLRAEGKGMRDESEKDLFIPHPSSLIPQKAAGGSGLETAAPSVVKPKQNTRIILFSVGFLSAVFLLVLMSFNFRSDTATNPNKVKSIAILPVQPLTAENRDVIYEFGIADSLTLKLGAAKTIIVRPLSATRQYADITQDALAAGKELQVDYVLASNYQIADGKIRVTSQLFNVATGQIEETYKSEKETSNIFATQDAIAGEVGNIILARFAIKESNPAAKRGTTNEEAYRLYLQGKNLIMQRTTEDSRKAVEYLEQAIRLDPNFARGYSGLALAYHLSAGGSEKAKAAVEKALELDNNLSEAYVVRGITGEKWDFPQEEKDLLRAIELEPNNDLAHWFYGMLIACQGRFDEGIREEETAMAISPGTVVYMRDRARILFYAHRYDEAIVQYKRALETDEGFEMVWGQLADSYEMNGDYAMAYETRIKQQEKFHSEDIEDIEAYKKAYAAAGWQGIKRIQLEDCKLVETETKTDFYYHARLCAKLGEKEQAFTYLNKAFEKRSGMMIYIYVDPRFDSLRDDPRFDEMLRRVGFK